MAYEMLMGLNVIDDAAYQAYREAMTPILTEHGGGFGYDFRVSEVLKSATDAPMNRVFTIHFPDEQAKNAFFSNEAYLAVRQRHFDAAVTDSTMLAKYER